MNLAYETLHSCCKKCAIGFVFIVTAVCIPFLPGAAQAQTDPALVMYPGPTGAPQNTAYAVQVRKEGGAWQNLFCYSTEVGAVVGHATQTSYAYFDANFSTRIEVKVTKNSGSITSARIRPTSFGITPTTSGNTISFFLDKPRKISVEFNGDLYNNLQLFANLPEVNPPKQGDPGVTYFGPGTASPGTITLSSNQTVYIAGGAYVQGNISVSNATNVKILGRGVLQAPASFTGNMIRTSGCRNITIEGIILTRAREWTVRPNTTDSIKISNLKIINSVIYSDGIDPVSCRFMTVEDVFLRTGDDCMSIKASGANPNTNITVKNSTFWSDCAHAVLIGPEGGGAVTSNILYDSIEVLECNCPAGSPWWGVVGMTCSGDVTMRDCIYQNFNVDDFTLSELFNLRIESNQYVSTPGRAIRNIKYINWSYTGPNRNQNLIQGYDASRTIDSIYFINLRINGNLILNATQANCQTGSNAFHIFFQGPTQVQNQITAQGGTAIPSAEARLFIPGKLFQLPASDYGMKVYSLQGRMLTPEAEWRGFAGTYVSKFNGITLK